MTKYEASCITYKHSQLYLSSTPGLQPFLKIEVTSSLREEILSHDI